MSPPAKGTTARTAKGPVDDGQSAVIKSRNVAKLLFDRIHARDAAEVSSKTPPAKKVGVKKAKVRRR